MKQTLLIVITTLSILSCKAQQPILPLYNGSDYLETQNAYYKDVDGDLQKLIGTWKYISGNENFELQLRVKYQNLTEFPVTNFSCYEDIIYGEYKYVDKNGVEISNTLSQINLNSDPYNHTIYGGYIIDKYNIPTCDDCDENERRIVLNIKDSEREYFDYNMIIRHVPGEELLNIPDRIKISIRRASSTLVPENEPDNDRITIDELILKKQ